MTTEQVFLSSEAPKFALDYKNLNSVKFVIYRLEKNARINPYSEPKQSYQNLKKGCVQVYSKLWQLPEGKPYETSKLEGVWSKLSMGTYLVEMTEPGNNTNNGL